MRLATLRRGGRDGTLAVLAPDGASLVIRPAGIPTLQAALDDWDTCEPLLRKAAIEGESAPFEMSELHSPLPRAYQWAEALAYLTHMRRIRGERKMPYPPRYDVEPLAYRGHSDVFLGPTEPIATVDVSLGLDFEATLAVITDDVPIGTTADKAPPHIRLVLLTNDVTYRNLTRRELERGFGVYQAKPPRPHSPFAVTPDELGDAWDGLHLRATVRCWVNDQLIGELHPDEDCDFDFGDLMEYMTRTRPLLAGTIIGSGTISNALPERGFGCLSEKHAVELARDGESLTEMLRPGDTLRIEAFDADERSIFGAMHHAIVHA